MELIDRAEAIRVADGYCHYASIPKELEKLPTIKAIPVEVLQEIRHELINLADADAYGDYQQGFNFGLMKASQIVAAKMVEYTGEGGK